MFLLFSRQTLVAYAFCPIAVILSVCPGQKVPPIGVKFCTMADMGPEQVFSPFGGDTPRDPQNPKFWPSKKRISRKR